MQKRQVLREQYLPFPSSRKSGLLELDLGAGSLQLLLIFASASGAASLMVCGAESTFLGFLQAQAGDLADNLDYVDLGGASLNQNNVEIGLGLGSRSAVSRAAANAGNSNRRSGNAKFFFQSLYQLRELHNLSSFTASIIS